MRLGLLAAWISVDHFQACDKNIRPTYSKLSYVIRPDDPTLALILLHRSQSSPPCARQPKNNNTCIVQTLHTHLTAAVQQHHSVLGRLNAPCHALGDSECQQQERGRRCDRSLHAVAPCHAWQARQARPGPTGRDAALDDRPVCVDHVSCIGQRMSTSRPVAADSEQWGTLRRGTGASSSRR